MLSIVVPALNEEKFLIKLLKDFQKQTYPDFEVIVADSRSEDDTAEIAEKFGCEVVPCERKGPGHGRNMGAERANGEYLLFLDADVRLRREDFLQVLMEKVKERDIRLATFFHTFEGECMIDDLISMFTVKILKNFSEFFCISPGFCTFITKELHERIGGFQEDIILGEDHNYTKRASRFASLEVIEDLKVEVSPRRFEKQGRLNVYLTYLYTSLYRQLNGEMRRPIRNYDFDIHRS